LERIVPDALLNILALQAAWDRTATALGRPLRRARDLDKYERIMVGDRLNTDIQFAKNVGGRGVLVLAGVTPGDDAEAVCPGPPPGFIYNSVAQIPDLVKERDRKAAEAACRSL
jgi:ribonucleotide monophosphatase NagD (HAD superfamily)